jgi:phosphoribosylanthranilate isomerase
VPSQGPRVKICCISSVAEARLAVRHGASALGLVSAMPSGPGVISEDTIAAIARTVPPPVASFLLTSRQDTAGIIEQQRRLRVTTLQIVDRLTVGTHRDLRAALPGIGLVQHPRIGPSQSTKHWQWRPRSTLS